MSVPSVAAVRSRPVADWGVVAGGYAVMGVALLVMAGWWLRVETFVTVLPGLQPMVFNTALCLFFLSLAAVLSGLGRPRQWTGLAVTVFVAGLAGLVLAQYAGGRDLGVDTLFHPADLPLTMSHPGRMGLNTAVCVVVLAAVILCLRRGNRVCLRVALSLSLLVAAVAGFALAGYAGRLPGAYQWGVATGMAVHTAFCVLVLSVVLALEVRRRLVGPLVPASWTLALAGAGFLLLTVGWIAYRSLDQLVAAERDVAHTINVSNHIQRAHLLLTGLESDHLAYLVTRDDRHLADTRIQTERLRATLAETGGLIADRIQAGKMRRFTDLAEAKLRLLDEIGGRARAGSPGQAEALLRAPSGRELQAGIDEVVRQMLAAEEALLGARRIHGARAVAEARGVLLLGFSMIFILGAGGVLLLLRTQRALAESRERFESIFASVAEGIILHDMRGAIVEGNAAAERLLGLSSAQLVGRDSFDPRWRTVREDGSDCPPGEHSATLALRTGRSQRDQIMGVHRPDGSLVWLSINSEPILDSGGRVRAVVTSFFDFTARRAAEQALRDSEERWKFAIEGNGDGLWDWDAATDRVFFSPRWKSMLGHEEHEIGDRLAEWSSRIHPDDRAAAERALREHFEGKTPIYVNEHRLRAKDGTYRWIFDRGKVVTRAADGRPLRVIGTHTDVTARRVTEQALRESEERFRSTFDHAGIGMAIVALDGRWLRANPALCRIVGYDEAALRAKTFQDITHPEDLDADLDQARRLLAGEIASYQMEKRYLHADGRLVWIRLTASVVRDAEGAPVHFVSQIEDIDDRKLADGKLAAYAARLAAKNRELRDFAYVASHDLQEPLRKIQAFGDRLERLVGPRLDEGERDYLARMRAAAARMSALIDALLAYSRVTSQVRAFAPVALDQVLREALQDLELRLETTGGRVEAGPLPVLQGDAVQLRQLFQNLLGNALKYHRPGTPPRIRVSAGPATDPAVAGPAWAIRFEDDGIGFEPRHAEDIFGVFQRLHTRDAYEGTGVGLAICRRIVERHGGHIRAEGRPGEGAVFTIVLPSVPGTSPLDP